jgi:hypothetical protein
LRLGDGGGALWRLRCKEISINKLHSGKSSVKAGQNNQRRTLADLEADWA